MIIGSAIRYGDNIDTDVIIPARYLTRFAPAHLAKHCMEDLDSDFLKKRKPGDILVAGNNFGCGSSREVAPVAIKAAEISCIIAKSFARIFYRNAINIGMPIFECAGAVENIQEGDNLEVDPQSGIIRILNRSESYRAAPFSPVIREIIEVGGLVNFVKGQLQAQKR